MIHLNIRTVPAYEVLIGDGLLSRCGSLISEKLSPCRAAVITDDKVDALYGETVTDSLKSAGFEPIKYVFKNGEGSKNPETLLGILEFLAENRFTRTDLAVALGGGVVGDIAGFAASCYLRGIPFVQLPTTLLSAVDSSVGGKTAINLKSGKNLAGAFYQPSLVICDCSVFSTLDKGTFSDGAAEVIKYGMIKSDALFMQIASVGFKDKIPNTIARCVAIKSDLVTLDERDNGERQLLNFGHTLAHAIEKRSDYTIPHGRAVAMGMSYITSVCAKRGICPEDCSKALDKLLSENGLETKLPYSVNELFPYILSDKKRSGNKITLIVPEKIGNCVRIEKNTDELIEFLSI